MSIINFISTIRNSFYGSETVYTQGSCYNFHLILKEVFPDAVAYFEDEHIVSKIEDKFYDITGEVEPQNEFILFEEVAELFQDLIKNNKFGITGYVECPNCYEHFKVEN